MTGAHKTEMQYPFLSVHLHYLTNQQGAVMGQKKKKRMQLFAMNNDAKYKKEVGWEVATHESGIFLCNSFSNKMINL